MNILFGSVVYQEAFKYFEDFFQSVEKQNYQNFKVLLINDNIPETKLAEKLKKYSYMVEKTELINVKEKKEPYQLRIELLKEAYSRDCDLLIMGDCDDKFSENRIAAYAEAYDEENAFYYNTLLNWEQGEIMPELPEETVGIEDIGEKNYLGLSNTAINLKRLSWDFLESLEEGKTNIFDWYLYSRILLLGEKGKRIKRGKTYYRIHQQNMAGVMSYTQENLEKEIKVKIEHYRLLEKYHVYYKEKLNKYLQIDVEHVAKQRIPVQYFWWGLIK